ncbi:MAG TPA: agmatine deiminase family protein, partial [Methanomicrobiales archaeon]|nr:agmatine deiminase family protein [Methanomicrobiales archaeon]
FRVYDTDPARFAVLICYDQWFPEAARAATLRGAEIIFYPTAIGWIGGDLTHDEGDWHGAWETVQRGHAIANGVHVAAVNRAGQEGDLLFWGGSFVADAFGGITARAGDGEEVLLVDVDLSMNRRVREGWGFLRNRRPDTYGILTHPVVREYPPASGLQNTPKKQGFSMPAEWEPHESVWLAWPQEGETFGDIPAVEETYLGIIAALTPGERVNLLVRDRTMELRVKGLLTGAGIDPGRVNLTSFDYADVWFRDYGPAFVVNREAGTLGMVSWEFNAWGNRYPGLARDNRIPSCLGSRLGLPVFQPGIVLEGGAIDVNGRGAVLTTEQCLLNPNRNPGLPKEGVEPYLREFLGVSTVIWLKGGIAGDDTDGHIDDVARFVNPSTVVYAVEEDQRDENHRILRENERVLAGARDQDGNPLEIIPVPMPGRLVEGMRLPASYLNFFIGNKAVLVPTFADPNDENALGIFREVFPGKEVVGIDCRALVEGMGAIHCVTQQQPRPG